MKHLTRYNTMMFITTKREEFADDREVRAMLWIRDEYAGINRHYDIDNVPPPRPLTPPDPTRVKDYHRRMVDIAVLVTEIVVNPKATSQMIARVGELVKSAGTRLQFGSPDWLDTPNCCHSETPIRRIRCRSHDCIVPVRRRRFS
jgi:hypothetical protein